MAKKMGFTVLLIACALCGGAAVWLFRAQIEGAWHAQFGVPCDDTDHTCSHDAHAGHDHRKPHDAQADPCRSDGHEGHDHGGGGDLDMSLEQILTTKCECDELAYQCPGCRHEVGVVQVNEALMGKSGIVNTIAASEREVESALRVTGEVQLNENAAVHISPRISGVVRSVAVDVGAQVKEGDVLFQIDSIELGQAVAEYEKNRALLEISRKNYDRERSLYERKISSEQDMLESRMKFEEYQTQFNAARQKLYVLGLTDAELARVKPQEAGRLAARAPLSGRVIEKHAVTGELVEPGTSVMTVADLSQVWVWADIYEDDLATLIEAKQRVAIPAHVTVHAYGKRLFKGEIDYIGATMDEKTRTVKVRATVQNTERLLRPGMFCEIRILLPSAGRVLAIPRGAVLSDDGRHFVFKHLKDDLYVRRPVRPGRAFDHSIEILDGLKPGETIIVDGSFLLKSDVLRAKMGAGCAH